jgi:hypothetical protein
LLAGFAFYQFYWVPAHRAPFEVAYVLPPSVTVVDTPAEIRLAVATLRSGDKVEVLARTRNWAHVRLADRRSGWIELKDLLDAATHDQGQALLQQTETEPAQARGHVSSEVNVHLEPSRAAPQLTVLHPNEQIGIFARRMVERPVESFDTGMKSEGEKSASGTTIREAWYLMRAGSHAGWVLGRFVNLDVPPEISQYAQGINTVAWLVLATVDDNGRKVPEYLVADRVDTQEFDFNHIRVFTWWAKKQIYATAYVESRVDGFFPIRTAQVGGTPYFRLRMLDDKGRKVQKVYGMYDTIVRPLGYVDGWQSEAIPERPTHARARRR